MSSYFNYYIIVCIDRVTTRELHRNTQVIVSNGALELWASIYHLPGAYQEPEHIMYRVIPYDGYKEVILVEDMIAYPYDKIYYNGKCQL